MYPSSSRVLLNSIVKLTERPDVRAFEAALAATLRGMAGARVVRFAKMLDGSRAQDGKVIMDTPHPADDVQRNVQPLTVCLEQDHALVQCLNTELKVVDRSLSDGGCRVLHPLRLTGGIVGALILEYDSDTPPDQEMVHGMLGFYKNYVSLLNENQRDKLTGLFNRKTFDDKILRMIAAQRAYGERAADRGRCCCLAIIDIDHFKKINDVFGHLYGDEVLLVFAQTMSEAFRGDDMLFRIGGEEFVVVLQDVLLATAMEIFERFRITIQERGFPGVGTITISIGVSAITGSDLPTNILGRADRALYYAKDNGRNRVCSHEYLVAEGKLAAANKDAGSVELFNENLPPAVDLFEN